MLAHEIQTGVAQHITTMLDQTIDDIQKDFRCNCCGKIVFQYYGGIRLILPGQVEIEWLDIVGRPKVIQCKNKRKIWVDDDYNENKKEIEVKCKTIYFVIG